MAERIQLKEPGSMLTMVVTSVRPEIVERNEYYLFSNGNKELLVPQSSIKGRFERLGVTAVEQLVGKPVRFARSTKMSRAGTPYWDIDVFDGMSDRPSGAEQSAGGGTATGNPASAPSVEPSAKPKMRDAYKSLTEWVIKEILPLYDAVYSDGACTPDVVAACVQTLFIQACKSGKVE